MNYFDAPSDEENFEDKPEEIDGQMVGGQWVPNAAAPVSVTVQKAAQQAQAPTVQEDQEIEEEQEEDSEEDTSNVLTDARLRLEMGKLYELIMKHDLFEGVDSDPKAMKTVQKEIRAYAQERMEIMLGMRQEQSKEVSNSFPMDLFPFNSLEVEALKALAAAATKGASRDAEPLDLGPQRPQARTSLNPIGKGTGKTTPRPVAKKPLTAKPQDPVKRSAANAKIQRILAEEGLTMDDINHVFDPNREYLDRTKMAKMTEEQIIERNRQVSLRNKRAENPAAAPMPTAEQMEQAIIQRSAVAEAQKPGWRELMSAVKAMPPTKVDNVE